MYKTMKRSERTDAKSIKNHIKEKDMWAGKKTKITEECYILNSDNIFTKERKLFSPALYKIIDEIIVNANDHSIKYPKLVKNIHISFDEDKGLISVRNDGPGIPLYVAVLVGDVVNKLDILEFQDIKSAKDANIKNLYCIKWNAQVLVEQPFSGSNYKDTSKEIHIRGGTNGIGMKIVNYYSSWFKIESVDENRKKIYTQTFSDGTNIIDEPIIKNYKNKPYTEVSFIPNYEELGYKKLTNDDKKLIKDRIETRAYQVAVSSYANVYFNNKLINVKSLSDLVKMHIAEEKHFLGFHTILKPKNPPIDSDKLSKLTTKSKSEIKSINWSWEVSIIPNCKETKAERYSLINGVFLQDGTHLKYIEQLLIDSLKPKVEKYMEIANKQWRNTYITDNINIYVNCIIDCPSFSSQSKVNLSEKISKFEGYKFTKKNIDDIYEKLEPTLLRYAIEKFDNKNKTTQRIGDIPKYYPALNAGPTNKRKNKRENTKLRSLFIPEGDSAKTLIDKGLSNKKIKEWDRKYNGIFNIQGVPVNGIRYSKLFYDENGEERIIPLRKVIENERMMSLFKVLGLDFRKHYTYNTKKGDDEFSTLRYDRIIIAVDQDEDGKGNICTLILGNFSKFWPELFKRRFICRMNTPIIRAFSKKPIKQKTSKKAKIICKSFYTEGTYTKWENENHDSLNLWNIEYFKGLAATSESAVTDIFENLEDRMYTYIYTEDSEECFKIYLDTKSSLRKRELSNTKLLQISSEIRDIKCEEHLKSDAKEFQLYNIHRSIPGNIDGLNPSRRKILCAALNYFSKNGNKSQKVATFGGYVVENTNYHHGEASLYSTIIKMGQQFYGSNTLPLLRGVCIGFGDRKSGGNDAGAPRYIKCKLNNKLTDLLFPKEDNYLLNYTLIEGNRCQPDNYVPIFPLSCIENIHLPAHAWQTWSWGRDWTEVMDNVLGLIKNEIEYPAPMVVNTNNWKGDLYHYTDSKGSRIFSVGTYKLSNDNNTITITELPHGVYSDYLVNGKKKKKVISKNRTIKSVGLTKYNKKRKRLPRDYGKEYDNIHIENDDDDEYNHNETIKDKPVVKNVIDLSEDNNIDIEIQLKPGGYDYIIKNHNSVWDDPIIEYFGLRRVLCDNLNFLDTKGKVKHYTTYEELLMEWFKERKKLYSLRVDRKLLILELQLSMEKMRIKYINFSNKYKLHGLDEESWIAKFKKEKYPMFNESVVNNPGFIKNDKILFHAKKDKSKISYNYLLNLSQYDFMKKSIDRRRNKINSLEAEINKLSEPWVYFKGDSLWLDELGKLKKVIKNGIEKGWGYDEPDIIY